MLSAVKKYVEGMPNASELLDMLGKSKEDVLVNQKEVHFDEVWISNQIYQADDKKNKNKT